MLDIKGRVVVIPHFGTGDQLILNGGIRYLASKPVEITVVVREDTLKSVSWMYRDLDNVKLVTIPCYHGNYVDTTVYLPPFCSLLRLGTFTLDSSTWTSGPDDKCFARCYYDQLGVPYEERHNFYVDLDVPDAIAVPNHEQRCGR